MSVMRPAWQLVAALFLVTASRLWILVSADNRVRLVDLCTSPDAAA